MDGKSSFFPGTDSKRDLLIGSHLPLRPNEKAVLLRSPLAPPWLCLAKTPTDRGINKIAAVVDTSVLVWLSTMVSFLGLCRLLDDHNYADVARILNENGFKRGDGLKLTSPAVGYDRTAYGLRSRFDQLRARGRLTMLEISKSYGVSTNTIFGLATKGSNSCACH